MFVLIALLIYLSLGLISNYFWDEFDEPESRKEMVYRILLWPLGWYYFFKAGL